MLKQLPEQVCARAGGRDETGALRRIREHSTQDDEARQRGESRRERREIGAAEGGFAIASDSGQAKGIAAARATRPRAMANRSAAPALGAGLRKRSLSEVQPASVMADAARTCWRNTSARARADQLERLELDPLRSRLSWNSYHITLMTPIAAAADNAENPSEIPHGSASPVQ